MNHAEMVVTINGTRIAGWSSNPLIANVEEPVLSEVHYELAAQLICAQGHTQGMHK